MYGLTVNANGVIVPSTTMTSQFDEKDAVRAALYTDLSNTFTISNDIKFPIDARTLWKKLEIKDIFNAWFKRSLEKADPKFVYGVDYILSTENLDVELPQNGGSSMPDQNTLATENLDVEPMRNGIGSVPTQNSSNKKDYNLTVEMSKKLAMMANTKIGDMARDYFIACENELKTIVQQNNIAQRSNTSGLTFGEIQLLLQAEREEREKERQFFAEQRDKDRQFFAQQMAYQKKADEEARAKDWSEFRSMLGQNSTAVLNQTGTVVQQSVGQALAIKANKVEYLLPSEIGRQLKPQQTSSMVNDILYKNGFYAKSIGGKAKGKRKYALTTDGKDYAKNTSAGIKWPEIFVELIQNYLDDSTQLIKDQLK